MMPLIHERNGDHYPFGLALQPPHATQLLMQWILVERHLSRTKASAREYDHSLLYSAEVKR